MKGLTIFEAINDMNDELITSSLIHKSAPSTAGVYERRESGFKRFMNSGWGVAAVCALVSVGVLGGIIWAGQQPGENPPWGTVESEESDITSNSTDDANQTDEQTTEEITVEPETTVDPIRITEFNSDSHLNLFTTFNGEPEITEEQKLRIKGSWERKDLNSPYVSFNVFDLMKTSPSYDATEMEVPGMIFMKLTYENCEDLRFVSQGAVWGSQADKETIQTEHIKLQYAPYESTDVYLIIRIPEDEAFAKGEIPYLIFQWYHKSGETASDSRAVVFEEITFYPDYASAISGLTTRLAEDGHGNTALNYTDLGDGKSMVGKNQEFSQPLLTIPSKDENGRDVISVSEDAFQGNDLIYQVIISEGIERIEAGAFNNCASLTEIVLPDSLLYIEYFAFDNFRSLKELHIGKNLKYVGEHGLPAASNSVLTDIYYNGTIEEFKKIHFESKASAKATVHCKDGDILFTEAVGDPSTELPAYVYKDLSAFLATAEAPQLNAGETVVEMQAREIRVSESKYRSLTYVLRYGIVADRSKEQPYRIYFDILSAEDGRICKVGNLFDATDPVENVLSYMRYSGLVYAEPSYAGGHGVLYAYFYDDTATPYGNQLMYGYTAYTVKYDKVHGLLLYKNDDYAVASYREGMENSRTSEFLRAGASLESILSEAREGGDGRLLAVVTPCGDQIAFKPTEAPILGRVLTTEIFYNRTPFKELLSVGLEGMYKNHGLYKKEN